MQSSHMQYQVYARHILCGVLSTCIVIQILINVYINSNTWTHLNWSSRVDESCHKYNESSLACDYSFKCVTWLTQDAFELGITLGECVSPTSNDKYNEPCHAYEFSYKRVIQTCGMTHTGRIQIGAHRCLSHFKYISWVMSCIWIFIQMCCIIKTGRIRIGTRSAITT